MEPYRHRPLSAGKIRLFHMEPCGDFDFPIAGSLKETSVTLSVPYIALSYAWGPTYEDGSHLTEFIICEDCILRVTPNLKQLLLRMRSLNSNPPQYQGAPHEGRFPPPKDLLLVLWIDALCIDQGNLEERAQQVRLMPNIYNMCRYLFIWLGELLPGTLSDVQEAMLLQADSPTSRMSSLRKALSSKRPAAASSKHPAAESREKHKKVVESILDKPWFHRRWVIQETQHAADDWTYLLIGDTIYLKKHFLRILKDFGLLEKATPFKELPRIRSIFKLLYLFDSSECNDPRDRLFALTSLTCAREQTLIDVDYNGDVRDSYLNLVKRLVLGFTVDMEFERAYTGGFASVQSNGSILQQLQLIRTLVLASCKKVAPSEASMESWVPDWRIASKFESDWHKEAVDLCLQHSVDEESFSWTPRSRPDLLYVAWKLDVANNGYHYLHLTGTILKPSRESTGSKERGKSWANGLQPLAAGDRTLREPLSEHYIKHILQESHRHWPQSPRPSDRMWLVGMNFVRWGIFHQIIGFVLRAGQKVMTFRDTPVYHLHSCFVLELDSLSSAAHSTERSRSFRLPASISRSSSVMQIDYLTGEEYDMLLRSGQATPSVKKYLAEYGIFPDQEFYLE